MPDPSALYIVLTLGSSSVMRHHATRGDTKHFIMDCGESFLLLAYMWACSLRTPYHFHLIQIDVKELNAT